MGEQGCMGGFLKRHYMQIFSINFFRIFFHSRFEHETTLLSSIFNPLSASVAHM